MKKHLFILSVFLFVTGQIFAQFPFGEGNIVVVRVGNGEVLSHTGNYVFLDEYDTDGNLVQSIKVKSGSTNLILDGTDEFCGYLNRSADNQYLTLAGFDATPGSVNNLDESNPATVNRLVAVVDINAAVDLSTRYDNLIRTPRGVCSDDGTNLWLSAPSFKQNGMYVFYGTKGSSETTGLVSRNWSALYGLAPQYFNVKIFPDLGEVRLFYSTHKTSTTGAGESNGSVSTPSSVYLPKEQIGNNTMLVGPQYDYPCDYVYLDQTGAINHMDVCYYVKPFQNGLKKLSNTNYYLGWFTNTHLLDTCKYYGITLESYTNNTAVLYATRYNSISGLFELVKITDNTGWNDNTWEQGLFEGDYSIKVLASAPSGTTFRGVAMAPVARKPQYLDINSTSFSKEYLDSSFTFNAVSTSGLPLTFSYDEDVVTIQDSVVTIHKVDSITVYVNQEGNDEYLPMETYLGIQIAKSKQYVKNWIINGDTYENPYNGAILNSVNGKPEKYTVTTNNVEFNVHAQLNSGLDYYLYSSDEDIVEVDGNTFTLTGETGESTIYVIQDAPTGNFKTLETYNIDSVYLRLQGLEKVQYFNYFVLNVTEPTGVNITDNNKAELKVYPNPVNFGNVNLSYPEAKETGEISLYSLSGQLLLQKNIEKGSTNTIMNIKSIPPGIYIVSYGSAMVKVVKE